MTTITATSPCGGHNGPHINQGRVDPARQVFNDGSPGPSRRWRGVSPQDGSKTDMVALRGWATCGERLIG